MSVKFGVLLGLLAIAVGVVCGYLLPEVWQK